MTVLIADQDNVAVVLIVVKVLLKFLSGLNCLIASIILKSSSIRRQICLNYLLHAEWTKNGEFGDDKGDAGSINGNSLPHTATPISTVKSIFVFMKTHAHDINLNC